MADGFAISKNDAPLLRRLLDAYKTGGLGRVRPDATIKKTPLIETYIGRLNSDIGVGVEPFPTKSTATLYSLDLQFDILIPKQVNVEVYSIDCFAHPAGQYVGLFKEPYSGRFFIIPFPCYGSGSGGDNLFDIGCGLLWEGQRLVLDSTPDDDLAETKEVLTDAALCWDGTELCFTKTFTSEVRKFNQCGMIVDVEELATRTECGLVADCLTECCPSGSSGSGGGSSGSGGGGSGGNGSGSGGGGSPVEVACCSETISQTVTATFSLSDADEGGCDSLNGGTVTLTYDSNDSKWKGSNTIGGVPIEIHLYCSGMSWVWDQWCDSILTVTNDFASEQCDPFQLVTNDHGHNFCCSESDLAQWYITFTEA